MNTIIIYSSKYGCTKDCANILKNKLSDNVTIVDINDNNTKIELSEFDAIIIGSSIYAGLVSKKIRVLCNDNIELLNKKQVGIFICCGFSEQSDKYLKSNFPSSLLESANAIGIFGGEARLEKMNFLDKLIMKSVTKGNYDNFRISQDKIDDFLINFNN
ncbi:flavodoxin domain-containing protein [Clostridioides sp. ES-S-0108-01]|uniref:flavodoxin domain-containing protein n=1 Tax=unclassified Clostridioides TaxID=2635829 RepID=UPI001D0C80AA|nr:flavodoxin domain-containing protein [Clostridioides sp. ES-S-0171-01]MCC0687247.1 flavodoxin domain-containing protein [Clostridioides sp. ES-S-0056-01]MCC0716204.1 flavodoxin domain-containing protein [Clostridioides sp. ES-S-0077-01]MCC0782280.1 flavodoxin domain-containing protein [Clostridioides sp. ES-S-0108-01]UDN52657.1 flavodoxin domain-containing protein [Clostridioides sp. ES-S-0107-01]UDN56122.1 flavodoxin domain-containing protein [Clostridioides sp. ES-S-0054-01]